MHRTRPAVFEPISLRLRNPVEERQLRKISLSPRPKFLDVHSFDNWGDGGREVVIEGQFIPGTTYTVRVPSGLRDIYGQSIPAGATRSAVIAPRATLALSSDVGILVAAGRQTVGVESRHVTALHLRVGIFTDAELQDVVLEEGGAAKADFPARVVERDLPLTPSGKADWSAVALDLAEITGGVRRPVLVEVSAGELTPRAGQYGLPAPVRGLFRLTDLGPVALLSLPASSVQVLRLSTGAPVSGAHVHRFDPRQRGQLMDLGVTDVAGLLALPAELVPAPGPRPVRAPATPPAEPPRPPRLTITDPATDDHAHLDLVAPGVYRDWSSPEVDQAPSPLRPGERLIARLVSERGVYRPGEQVRVVGWSALDTPFSRSNLGQVKAGSPVVFELVDNFNKVVVKYATRTSANGKFWAELAVPTEAALGRYTVRAELVGSKIETTVKVEDYRVPEYSVDATARRPDILAGEQTTIDVHATYYFGGPVPFQRLTRQTSCNYRRFRPPGLEDMWSGRRAAAAS